MNAAAPKAAGARPRVAVVGASGYAGRELCHWLERHPGLELCARLNARPGIAPPEPELPVDAPLGTYDPAALQGLDGVFLCTPHGTAAPRVEEALANARAVVDLSADFRLRDPELYASVYGAHHPRPALLGEAVYGLTEHFREPLAHTRLVANPGCYPTAVLTALLPLEQAGLLAPGAAVVADCKSGLSGAGKEPSDRTHFGSVHENFQAYGIGNHRHGPEIEAYLSDTQVIFVPHLLPIFRGILATLYLDPAPGFGAGDVRACLAERYAAEPFVRVYERGWPKLDRVQRTNQCHLGVAQAGSKVVVISCLDNLVKGAAGQAIQNMNLLLGRPESEGLA